MAINSGGSRISRGGSANRKNGGVNHKDGGTYLLIWLIFGKNCMKTKKPWTQKRGGGGGSSLAVPVITYSSIKLIDWNTCYFALTEDFKWRSFAFNMRVFIMEIHFNFPHMKT